MANNANQSGVGGASDRERADRGLGDHVAETRELVVAYAKQETVEPLKSLGRFLGFGAAGALMIGIALILLLLGLLRGLQEIEMFDGATGGMRWSWVPYLITFLVGALLMALVGLAAKREWTTAGDRARGR